MCFETTKYSKLKRAKKDIPCWKILNKNYTPLFYKENSPYKSGVLNPIIELIKIEEIIITDFPVFIYEGYHSYQMEKEAMAIVEKMHILFIVRKFIIPKDTLYYKNDTEYISETIIMK